MTHSPFFNRGRRRLVATLPLLATGLFLKPALADPLVRQASQTLMGTQVDITVQGPSPDAGVAAIAAAFTEMSRLSDMMSRYNNRSAVSALHLASGLQPVVVEPEMMRVLKMARNMSERSHGAFDITVGAFNGWDFDPRHPTIPAAAEISSELPLVNYRDLMLNDQASTAYLRHRGMRIDLGGIAKLPILQAGMRVLQGHSVSNAMINGGGDVLVSGQLQGRDWRIGVRDPRDPRRTVGVVNLSEGFVASSGDYERYFMHGGHRYHHILNPKTGLPTNGLHGVTLVSRKIEDINGLGAAIMVAGAAAGRHMVQLLGGVDTLIAGSGQHGLWLSPGMAARLHA